MKNFNYFFHGTGNSLQNMAKPQRAESQLPQREAEICGRVRMVRMSLKWSQPDFATELEISRERLASYEYARAPIRYELGRRLCHRFGMNQRWFATGKFPLTPYFDLSPSLEVEIKPRELFSSAFDRVLHSEVENKLKDYQNLVGEEVFADTDPVESASDNFGLPQWVGVSQSLDRLLRMQLRRLPEHLQRKLSAQVFALVRKFRREHAHAYEAYLADKASKEGKASRPSSPARK